MSDKKRSGTQSIERAVLVLRELAKHGRFGWALGELAERCGLDRGTTHRILACLVRERLVQQRKSTRHYLPGPLIYELGLAIPYHVEFVAACEPILKSLAKRFRATSVFYLRSGVDWVCAARGGPAVYGGTILEVGTRRPLLSSVGGAAILIAMSREEADVTVEHNKWQLSLSRNPDSIHLLERMLRRSRRLGYGFARSEVANNVNSFGVPIFDGEGQVFASLAVGAPAEDLPASEVSSVIEALRSDAKKIERQAVDTLPV